MFVDHRQEQWPEWLGTAESAYNNKKHTATQILPFEANYSLSPRMGFEGRRGKRFEAAEEFADVTNFIQTYLHKYWVFFDDLSCIGKPSRRLFQ